MSQYHNFKSRMFASERLCDTFVKTPARGNVEVLARSGLDFFALDAEHSPFYRARLDAWTPQIRYKSLCLMPGGVSWLAIFMRLMISGVNRS